MTDRPESTTPPAPDEASPAPSAESPRAPPGRKPGYIDQRRRVELIDLVAAGKGVHQALRQLDVPYSAYRNTREADPEFVEDVAAARRAADEELDENGRLMALTGDTEVLIHLWARRDKAKYLNLARKDRARERAEDAAERRLDRALRLHLAELAAAARAKERDPSPDDEPDAPDFSRLSDAELGTLRDLMAKACGDAPAG